MVEERQQYCHHNIIRSNPVITQSDLNGIPYNEPKTNLGQRSNCDLTKQTPYLNSISEL